MPQIFKTKYVVNFRKYRCRKKFRFGLVKMAKSNKIGETVELIAGYQEGECLWNVLSPLVVSFVKRQKLTASDLNKTTQAILETAIERG